MSKRGYAARGITRFVTGVHRGGDGRGARVVTLNGRQVARVMFADESRGRIRVTTLPLRVDKYGKRVLTRTLRGSVRVAFTERRP